MSEFQGIHSAWATPNELLTARYGGQAAMDLHQNALMRQQTEQQGLDATSMEYVARAAQQLASVGEPGEAGEAARAAAYPTVLQMLPPSLRGRAPAQYPGWAALQQAAALGTSSEKLGTYAADQASKAGMLPPGPGASAAPAGAYGQGGPNSATVPPEYMPLYAAASKRTGIPVDVLIAQTRQESGFNPNATGKAGEIGLMQILPSTARNPGEGMAGVDPATLRDPAANINFGADYLKYRMGSGNPSDPEVIRRGLHAYNGGGDPNYVSNVTRYLPPIQAAPSGSQPSGATGSYPPVGDLGLVRFPDGRVGTPTAGAPPSGAATAPPSLDFTAAQQAELRRMSTDRTVSADEMRKTREGYLTQNYQRQKDSIAQQHQALEDQYKAASEGRAQDEAAQKGGAFPGNAVTASANRIMRTLRPKILNGTATEEERADYALATADYTKLGPPTWIPDPNDPTKQVLASVPGKIPEGFPPPNFRSDGASGGGTSDRAPQIIPGTSKRVDTTAEQGKAGSFADRMMIAMPVMQRLDDVTTYTQRGLEAGGKFIGYNINSPEYQQLRTAQEAFLAGILRHESGQAVTDSEWSRYGHLYFPMPGEDVETIKLKAQIRQSAFEGMVREAGPGYKPTATAAGATTAPAAPSAAPASGGWSVKRLD